MTELFSLVSTVVPGRMAVLVSIRIHEPDSPVFTSTVPVISESVAKRIAGMLVMVAVRSMVGVRVGVRPGESVPDGMGVSDGVSVGALVKLRTVAPCVGANCFCA